MDAGVWLWRVLANELWRDKLVTLTITRDIFSQKLLAFAAKATRFTFQGLVFAHVAWLRLALRSSVRTSERKAGRAESKTISASTYAAMPGATGINVPDSETLSSRVEVRCHGGSVSTVVTG